jgi:DNA uptake protein ComE-like DNA-binding protein
MQQSKRARMSKSGIQSVRSGALRFTLITLTVMAAASVSIAAGGNPASAPAPTAPASAAAKKTAPGKPIKLVDINSASRQELKTLPGIGDAEADKIIAGRPYLTKVDLVTKNVLPQGPYVSLKDRIVATQKGPPPKPKP